MKINVQVVSCTGDQKKGRLVKSLRLFAKYKIGFSFPFQPIAISSKHLKSLDFNPVYMVYCMWFLFSNAANNFLIWLNSKNDIRILKHISNIVS